MWRGFQESADTESYPSVRSYFRPRISSISGVLAMTKQRFFTTASATMPSLKDDAVITSITSTCSTSTPNQTSHYQTYNLSVNPSVIESYGINGMCLTGTRSSFGELVAYSRSASARPSIDSLTAHAIYSNNSSDALRIHDQSDAELGADQTDKKCSDTTGKVIRGIILTIMIALSWVGTLHLLKISLNSSKQTLTQTNYKQRYNHTIIDSQHSPQYIQYSFDAPYFTTWFCSVWNILFLPIYAISHVCCCNRDNISTRKMFMESVQAFMEKGFTALQFFGRCGFFCVLWMLTNYMLIFSLRILDTTVVMALFSCTVSIVYLLSWVVLHQQFVGIRIVAVIICDTGIALLVYMDGVQTRTLAAVMIAFGSAIGSAVYKVFFKRMIGYTSYAQMSLFFSLVGLLNAFLMWPLVVLLYLCGAETIIWSQIPWSTLMGSAALSLTANILGNFGLVWTYEIFLTLGLFFAIPISSVIDTSIHRSVFRDMKLAGVLLILFGFMVVLLPDNWNEYLADLLRQRLAKWKRREQLKKNGRVQDTSTGHLSRLRTPSGRVK